MKEVGDEQSMISHNQWMEMLYSYLEFKNTLKKKLGKKLMRAEQNVEKFEKSKEYMKEQRKMHDIYEQIDEIEEIKDNENQNPRNDPIEKPPMVSNFVSSIGFEEEK